MFCTKCGKRIPDDSAFCPYCGAATAASDNPFGGDGVSRNRENTGGVNGNSGYRIDCRNSRLGLCRRNRCSSKRKSAVRNYFRIIKNALHVGAFLISIRRGTDGKSATFPLCRD